MEALTLDINVHDLGGIGSSGAGLPSAGALGGEAASGALGGVIGAIVFKGIDILLTGIGEILSKATEGSPTLKSTLKLMDTAVNMILMPIGEVMGAFLKPMALVLIQFGMKAMEWLNSVDGKGMMEIFRGMGEVVAGIGKYVITNIVPLMEIMAGTAVIAGAGALGGNLLGAFSGAELVAKGISEMKSISEAGADLILGGARRIGIAFELMNSNSKNASEALNMLSKIDATTIASNMDFLGSSAKQTAQDLLDFAQAVSEAKAKARGESEVTKVVNGTVNHYKYRSLGGGKTYAEASVEQVYSKEMGIKEEYTTVTVSPG